jgi:hypothetical protein
MSSPSTKLKEPSILLAGSNCQKLIRNVAYVLDEAALRLLRNEIDRNVVALFRLGEEHMGFAQTISAKLWRQRVSRSYYAALNLKRSVTLNHSGEFSTDVSDHKNIGDLPPGFPNANTYSTRLTNLRDDRNIADYSHLSTESDLIISSADAQALVAAFCGHAREYLQGRGILL